MDKHLDLSVFDARYRNDLTGAAAIYPKILLKVILLAYAKDMLSSRQIERACCENVIFIALSYGYPPDHSTIAAFIPSMQAEIESLFCNVLLLCAKLGLLGGTHFSLDGVWRQTLRQRLQLWYDSIWRSEMTTTITIPLDVDTARLYSQAPADLQKKFQLLLNLWLRDLIVSPRPLQVIMDEISQKAQERGLTSETLESLLNAE